ncbi:RluA family pseudouridine synthase [Moraxella sp. ZY210820]|uniref:RluA family pseudouridine synthase n=1 Tax=unclassified Moraxella TaxID=2685852 RepID=UPI00272FBD08|nr:RluA family pseudouridine synthase [Moraxella sp. ZY210820]WLF84372.1 RluA family pseudouridine synthase [Moraxella sp. ZY210820]
MRTSKKSSFSTKNPQPKSFISRQAYDKTSVKSSVNSSRVVASNKLSTVKKKLSTDEVEQDYQTVSWFDVTEYQDGQRVDNFLINRLKGVPKSRIYRLIREGEVRVNKKRVKADTRLMAGDQVRVAPIRYQQKNQQDVPVSDKMADGLLQRIVYEDDGLIVINKPSGLAVHGGSGVHFGLIEILRTALQKPYLELIHRIDRDTSGLVMIAKKRSILKKLQDLLREHKIRKDYIALVKGEVTLNQQLIDAPLLRYELANGERRVRISKDGKPSQTDWKVLQRFQGATLIQASPLTGRTHQIRVHGLSIGHPLLGDDKYGHHITSTIDAHRLCLHAIRLNIPDYPLIETDMPDDIQKIIDTLIK